MSSDAYWRQVAWSALCKQAAVHDEDEEKDKLTWFEWLSRGAVPALAYYSGVPLSIGLGGLAGGALANRLGYTETAEQAIGMTPELSEAVIEQLQRRDPGGPLPDPEDLRAYAQTKVPSTKWMLGGAAVGGLAGIYLIYKLLKAYRNAARKRQRRIKA